MAKETAEQKLLKIIEATDAQQSAAPAGGVATAPPAPDAVQQVADSVKTAKVSFQLPPFVENLLAPFKKDSASAGGALSVGLREINSLLMVVIAAVLTFFVFNFLKDMQYSKQNFSYSAAAKRAAVSDNLIPAFNDISEYLNVVSRRNIFQPLEKKEEEFVETTAPQDIRQIVEQTKDLKLVGVSWLNTRDSASALIENTNSGITYFLKQGDTINGTVVKEIYADSVILTLEGDNFKLNL